VLRNQRDQVRSPQSLVVPSGDGSVDAHAARCYSGVLRALRRGTVLYLGDALAYNLLPEDYINVLCRNDGPGFFAGKKGRKLEVQAQQSSW